MTNLSYILFSDWLVRVENDARVLSDGAGVVGLTVDGGNLPGGGGIPGPGGAVGSVW